MNGYLLRFLRGLVCCVLFVETAGAQDLANDSLLHSLSLSYPVKLYYSAIGENAHIYNGYEYRTPDRNIKGSPYFLTDALVPANIYYDESYYPEVPVQYDQVRDLVVIYRLDQNFKISLIPQKLNSFSLKNHEFIRISQDSAGGINLATGYYDRVYAGKSTVLVRRKKYVHEVTEYTSTVLAYEEDYHYYVLFDNQYVEVKNKGSVLSLFESKKSEVKSWLRKNKLKFKTDFEKTLIAAAAYYDQLTS